MVFGTFYIGRETQGKRGRGGGGESSKAIVGNDRERFLGIYIVVEMKFPNFVTFYEKHKLIVFSDRMIKCKISP